MNTPQLKARLKTQLTPDLGEAEAASVTRLVMEDLFDYRSGQAARALTEAEESLAAKTLNRLKQGEPVQYITGIADFFGLQLHVTPAVLIPRPETEELVEWILEDHPKSGKGRLLDLGTGSGCIPLAVNSRRSGWHCAGLDVSEAAIEIASGNSEKTGLEVTFYLADMLTGDLARDDDQYQVLVSNPPYIPPSERMRMGRSTLMHEPELALFAPEDDPLLFYRSIAEAGKNLLVAGGYLYLEINEFNSDEVVQLLEGAGYAQVQRRQDMQQKWRMIRATRPPDPAR